MIRVCARCDCHWHCALDRRTGYCFYGTNMMGPPRRTQHWMRGSSASPREYHDSCRREQRHAHRSHRPWVRTIRALRRWVGMCQLPGPPCHPLDLWHARHRGTSDSGMRAAAAGAASKLPCAGVRHGCGTVRMYMQTVWLTEASRDRNLTRGLGGVGGSRSAIQ